MDIASISIYATGMTNSALADAMDVKPMHPRRVATRARICEAANWLFFERGFALVTMEQIAAAADIQRSTLYLHFREKDEILAAIAADYTAKVRAVVALLPGPEPTLAELRDWVAAFAGLVAKERASTELLVTLSHLPNAPAVAVQFGQDLLAMMAERLSAVRTALKPGNHLARAWMIAVMDTLGWSLCNYARHGEDDMSKARLTVAAEGLYRFVRSKP